jgi:hypothetical protein
MHPHTGTLGISVLKSYRSKTVRKALLQAALIVGGLRLKEYIKSNKINIKTALL